MKNKARVYSERIFRKINRSQYYHYIKIYCSGGLYYRDFAGGPELGHDDSMTFPVIIELIVYN